MASLQRALDEADMLCATLKVGRAGARGRGRCQVCGCWVQGAGAGRRGGSGWSPGRAAAPGFASFGCALVSSAV